jgi:hypothetical protein
MPSMDRSDRRPAMRQKVFNVPQAHSIRKHLLSIGKHSKEIPSDKGHHLEILEFPGRGRSGLSDHL